MPETSRHPGHPVFVPVLWVLLSAFLICVLTARGFGSVLAVQLTNAAIASICAYRAIKHERTVYAMACIGMGAIIAACPWTGLLLWTSILSYISLSLACSKGAKLEMRGYNALALSIALIWSASRTDAFTRLITPYSIAILPILLTVLLWRFDRIRSYGWGIILPLALVFTIKDTAAVLSPAAITIESYTVPGVPVYPHGKVLARLVNGDLVTKGAASRDIGITNLIFGSTPNHSTHPIFLVEHDIGPSDEHPALSTKSLHQEKPWECNQLFGDEYVIASISRDGYWASNLGGSLKSEGRVVLGSLKHSGGSVYEPIIIKENGKTYIQDSDPFVDWLANGQRHVILELTRGTLDLRLVNLGAMFLSAIMLVFPALKTQSFSIYLCTVVLAQAADVTRTIHGDVLLVGREGGPHELSRSAGVVRSIIESGRPVVESSVPSSVVVVSRGRSYQLTGVEKLVVMAPRSTVLTNDGKIEVDDTPLGIVDQVVDARPIRYSGKVTNGVMKMGGVVFIATDAPAKLDWKSWLPQF